LLHCHDRGGWVDHSWETPDPDVVKESLKVLYVGMTGTYVDAFWHLLTDIDPIKALKWRAEQKAYLARYGRQSWFAWEHRDVTELEEAYQTLAEIVKKENDSGGTHGIEDM